MLQDWDAHETEKDVPDVDDALTLILKCLHKLSGHAGTRSKNPRALTILRSFSSSAAFLALSSSTATSKRPASKLL